VERRLAVLGALALLAPSAHSAMPAIINALNDKEVDLRRSAAATLGQLGPITADVPALVRALTNGEWYTDDCCNALAQMFEASTTEIIQPIIAGLFVIAVLVGIFWWFDARCKVILREWAEENGFQITYCKQRYLLMRCNRIRRSRVLANKSNDLPAQSRVSTSEKHKRTICLKCS